jgi:hypothetical protein
VGAGAVPCSHSEIFKNNFGAEIIRAKIVYLVFISVVAEPHHLHAAPRRKMMRLRAPDPFSMAYIVQKFQLFNPVPARKMMRLRLHNTGLFDLKSIADCPWLNFKNSTVYCHS